MKSKYLFPHRFKRIGLLILIPSAILGLYMIFSEWQPDFLTMQVPAFFVSEIFGEHRFISMVENNIVDEILGVLVIIGSLLVAFSKEKDEDELIGNIRLESLVWATYVNYGILLLALILLYDMSFYWVMLLNMFTILIFFIIRFHWMMMKFKQPA